MSTEPYIIFHIDGGIGKNIAATAVCKSIRSAYPDYKVVVVTAWPEVFLNNPDIYRVYKFGSIPYFYEDYIKDKNTKIFRLEPYQAENFIYKRKHLIEIWCDLLGIPCISKKPELFLTQREMLFAYNNVQKDGPILVVQSSGGAQEQPFYSWARDLPPSFAQDIINTVKGNFSKILHIRKDNQFVLENTIHITAPLRTLFCYITMADKILSIDSMVQHAAAAFNKPATVGWIANSPVVFGYDIHANILPASQPKHFQHFIDSYLEEADWVGTKFHECPFPDVNSIFNKEEIVKSLIEI